MLMLILQIILTVAAWRRGWKAWALAPVATGLSIGFVLGVYIGASGGTMDASGAVAVGFPVDLGILGTLIAMVASPRTAEQRANATGAAAEIEPEWRTAESEIPGGDRIPQSPEQLTV